MEDTNKYKELAKELHKKLKINDKQLIIELKKSLYNVKYVPIKLENKEDISKYTRLVVLILKIYTDFILLEPEQANDEN